MRLGVVLMNLGGPTSEESLRTFLYNLFKDTDIIKLGGGVAQELLARGISKFRSPKVAKEYKKINACPNGCTGSKYCLNRENKVVSTCCSPINPLTERQRRGLEKALKQEMAGEFVKVYTAMRYWRPFAHHILDEMREDEIDHVVLLPLYPQFSWTTSGSSFRDWENVKNDQIKEGKKADWKEFHVKNYHLNGTYLDALNTRIEEALGRLDEDTRAKTHLIFSAHGTPLAEVESGDPYTKHIEETVQAIMARPDRTEQYWLSYQSRVGPAKWTQPNTEDLVLRLMDYGIKNILMIPVAFVTDHIETLCELNMELRETIEEEGFHVETLNVTEGLNDHPLFIQALLEEVKRQIEPLKERSKLTSVSA